MNVRAKNLYLMLSLMGGLISGCTLDIKLENLPSSSVTPVISTVEYSSRLYRDSYSQSGHTEHTATNIGNGKILVVGGRISSAGIFPTNSIEIFDTSTKRWTVGPTFAHPSLGHTATLLADGTVLLVGGSDFDMSTTTVYSTVYSYDPTTNTLTQKASMSVPRSRHTATLLNDGTVLVVGGLTTVGATATVELYDPVANTWTLKASRSVSIGYHTATLLSDGKVFVAGGANAAQLAQASAAVYDPGTNTWTAAPNLAQARGNHSATLLDDGKVLVAGGYASNSGLTSAVLYNPATNTFSNAAAMPEGRASHSATYVKGWVVLAGGMSNSVIAYDSSVAYNSYTNTWVSLGTLTNARSGHSGNLVGETLFALAGSDSVGGGLGVGDSLKLTTLIDADDYAGAALGLPSWEATATLAEGRIMHKMIVLNNGKVLATGGAKFNVPQASTAVFNPSANLWTAGPNMSEGRFYHTMTTLPSGKIFIAGGATTGMVPSTTADIYDPATNTFSTITLPHARYAHGALLLANGKLMLTGGADGGGFLLDTDLYDEATNSWSTLTARPAGGYLESISALPANKFLLSGPFGSYIYDGTNDTWTATNPTTARAYHTAEVLPDGKVMLIGGQDGGSVILSSTEIYDPVANSWSAGPSLPIPVGAHTSAAMNSGKIAVLGGQSTSGQYLAKVYFYDPTTSQWTEGTAMSDARSFHACVLMPNDRVVVYGGQSNIFGFLPFWEQILDP